MSCGRLRGAVWACLLAAVAPTGASGQTLLLDEGWRWAGFDRTAGLPSEAVNDVVQTGDGRYWAATDSGLAWFDGFLWHAMGERDGVPERQLLQVAPDATVGLLAIAHHRLIWGDTSGFRGVPVLLDRRVLRPEAEPGVTEQSVSGVAALGPDDLLMLVGGEMPRSRRVLVRRRGGNLEVLDPPAELDLRSTLQTMRDGRVLLSAGGALWRWGDGGWRLEVRFSERESVRLSAFATNERGEGLAFIQDPEALRGLIAWDAEGTLRRAVAEGANPIVDLDLGPTGDAAVLHGTGDLRVRHRGVWSDGHARWAPPPLRAPMRFVRITADNDVWFGTARGLFVYRVSSTRWSGWSFPFPDPRNRVNAILVRRDGSVWTGTGDGIVIHRPEGSEPTTIREIHGVRLGTVTGVAEDGEGFVWVTSDASFQGAFRFDGRTWQHFGSADGLAAPRIHGVAVDRQGQPWFLGLGGPSDLTGGPGAFVKVGAQFERWGEPEGLPSGRVYDFAEEPDGTKWIVTGAGISRWRAGEWTHWERWRDVLPSGRRIETPLTVRSVAVGPDRAWFGDQRWGVVSIDGNDELRVHLVSDGLPSQDVHDVTVDGEGVPWVSTAEGICRFHESDWSCLGRPEGLAASVWPLVVRGRQVFIGTQGAGLQVLNLDELGAPPPRVVIEEPVVQGRAALLRWSAHAYMGSVQSGMLNTRYRLDHGTWSRWGTVREVTLQQLSPGQHTLQVQARGLLGTSDWEGTVATFRVPLPLLARPEFAFPLGTLLAATIMVGLIAWRQRRLSTAALRESEERLRALGQAAFEGICFSREGRILDVNERLAEMLGYSRAEMLGRAVIDFVAPSSRDLVAQRVHGLRDDSYQPLALRKDGSTFPVEVQARQMRYRGSELRATAVRDISELVRTQTRLLASEQKFARAFRVSPHAIWIAQAEDGRLIEVNQGLLRLFGVRRGEAIGKSTLEVGLWRDAAQREAFRERIERDGRVVGEQHVVRRRDGEERVVLLWSEPIELGGKRCFLSLGQDVTGQVRAQARLEENRRELRTLSRRLMEAQELERTRISRELHDEIGQALAAIKLNLQAVARLNDDDRINAQVRDGVAVVDATANEIRNLSRDLRPSVLDDLGLLPALEWYTARQAERAGLEVTLEGDRTIARQPRDIETACYRIVQEAITNVVRHANATRITVAVRVESGHLLVSVRDDGTGFDVATTEATDDRERHLGLIGMRERAQNAGGRLTITSQSGEGTVVEARFDMTDLAVAPPADAPHERESHAV